VSCTHVVLALIADMFFCDHSYDDIIYLDMFVL